MEYTIILGVGVSLLLQVLKKYSSSKLNTYIILFILVTVASILYHFLVQTSYWTDIVQILATAGAFHNFVIRRFEEESSNNKKK